VRELSLFTGAGGGLLGSMLLGWRTVAAVEYDSYCQRVLCARGGYMADTTSADAGSRTEQLQSAEPALGQPSQPVPDARNRSREAASWPVQFPVYPDVRTFHPVPGSCDIVTGGFPCQPFSHAGKRLGEDDPRNLWPHAVRILVESGAPLGFFENVPGLLSSGYFGTVLGDLAEAGFDAEWCVLGADDVGAPHRRKRLWILAYRTDYWTGWRQQLAQGGESARDVADRHGYDARVHDRTVGVPEGVLRRHSQGDIPPGCGAVPSGPEDWGGPWAVDPADVADTLHNEPQVRTRDGSECERRPEFAAGSGAASGNSGGDSADSRLAEPCVDGMAHGLADWMGGRIPRVAVGVSSRVNRLRALGNGQVPLTMAAAWTYLAREAGILDT
jgi:DNA (cytosine-5)-methyltransferase 1